MGQIKNFKYYKLLVGIFLISQLIRMLFNSKESIYLIEIGYPKVFFYILKKKDFEEMFQHGSNVFYFFSNLMIFLILGYLLLKLYNFFN